MGIPKVTHPVPRSVLFSILLTVPGQGIVVLAFVADPSNITNLKTALDTPGKLYTPTEAQLDGWLNETNDATNAFTQRLLRVGEDEPMPEKPGPLYPSVSRDTGAKVLDLVANTSRPIPIVKELEFIRDTLFCEWAYVIDLDVEVLEVYAGNRDDGETQTRFGEAEGVKAGQGPVPMGMWWFDGLPTQAEMEALGAQEYDE